MALEVTGTLHTINATKDVSDKFRKREFIVELADKKDPKYNQVVQFELTGDRCAALDEFGVGDTVRVEFNLRGREWRSPSGEVKYFNTLQCWRLERVGTPAQQSGGDTRNDKDELPF